MAAESFAERLWEELDEELRRYDISEEIIANIKQDFIKSFAVGAPPVTKIPGVPGAAILSLRINLYNLATAPGKVADNAATTLTRTVLGLPYAEYLEAERIAGGWFADRVRTTYTDAKGKPVFSPATEEAFREWVISSPARTERQKRTKPLLDTLETEYLARSAEVYAWGMAEIKKASDPGFIASQAMELEKRGVSEIAGRPINEVFRESHFASQKLNEHRQNWEREKAKAEQYKAVGDTARAKAHTANAAYIKKNMEKDFAEWRGKSKLYRGYLSSEPMREMQGQLDLVRARYYQLKEYIRLRGITLGFLNFLRTWREKGFSGVFREYVWLATINFIFRKETPLYYLYPPNLIGALMKKIPVPGLGAINRLRVRIAVKVLHHLARARQWLERKILRKLREKWGKFVSIPLKRLARKAASWLIAKLGLSKIGAAIGGAIGTAAGPIGSAIGAAIGAVVTFVVGIIVEKTWKPVFKGAVYLFAGSCGCLAIAIGGAAIGLPLLMASIFAPGVEGPGPGPGPPAAQVTVTKESCVKIVAFATWHCQNPRTIGNNTGTWKIKWQITVENRSSQTATVTISDEECGQTWNYTLPAGEKRTPNCIRNYNTNNPALHNTPITNSVTGSATVGNKTRPLSAMGILNIGTPPHTFPSGWPTSGIITQGPNVPCPSHGSMEAIDIGNVVGTPVYATHSGEVVEAGWLSSSCGKGVKITATVGTTTFSSRYCHLSRVDVSEGNQVTGGQLIGLMGASGTTGSHLHYSLIGLSMAPPYIPRPVCCCRVDIDDDGSWQDDDAQYCGSSSPGTKRCNASVSH